MEFLSRGIWLSQQTSHWVSFLLPSAHYLFFNRICRTQKLPSTPKRHSSLSTLFSGDPCSCSLTSAWCTGLLFPSRPSLPAANHPALGQKPWSFWVCPANYPETRFTPPTAFGFGCWHYFTCRLPERNSCFTKCPCHQALPTYSYCFPQLRRSNHSGGGSRDSWGALSFTHGAPLLPRSLIYWKFHSFVFPSKPPRRELFYFSF